MTNPGTPAVRHSVTAIVVAHDGRPWLDEALAGLRAQTRQPDRLVGVDTGSQDGSREVLAQAFGPQALLDLPRDASFGRAVSEAHHLLPSSGPGDVEWLWLLHDDCAPAPGALEELLRTATTGANVGIVGPKLREWPNGRRLIEMGVSIAGSGARETGLEYVEFDQGQHDAVRDVLSVSSAGMLIRRDVYEELGGFDTRLPIFRDDVDLGWRVNQAGYRVLTCPDALVHHAEAAHTGMREVHATPGRNRRIDRRHANLTLLSNVSTIALPLVALRLLIGSLLRTLFLLLVKWPEAAYDELAGMAGAFAHPGRLFSGRRFRKKRKRVSVRAVRRLRPPPWIGIQHAFDTLMALVSARSGTHTGTTKRARAGVETGPVSEDAEQIDDENVGTLRRVLTKPLPLIVLGLLAVMGLAGWSLWSGSGHLYGGGLLPTPDSGGELWTRYVESWHPVGSGSDVAAPPYLAVLAGLAVLVLGKAALLVDVLLVGSVPLAGLTAYLFTRRVARSRLLRAWAAVTYALLPATTGAIAGGRLGTCVALVALPLLAIAVLRAVGSGGTRGPSWPAAFMSAFLLAVISSFVPLAYVIALVLVVLAAVTALRSNRAAVLRLLVPLVATPLLLMPWTLELVTRPQLLFAEAGRISAAVVGEGPITAYAVALGSPGGPTAAPFWLFGALALAALVALARSERGRGVLAGWAVALTGLVFGVLQSRIEVGTESSVTAPAWPGFASALVAAGLIVAVTHAADGAVRVFGRLSFSWRQPVAGVLTIAVAATPLIAAGWWVVRGAEDPIRRDDGLAVPAYIADALGKSEGKRALVVKSESADELRYTVLQSGGPKIADTQLTAPDDAPTAELGVALSDLAGGAGEDVAESLADHGIGYLYLSSPANQTLAERLDTAGGLARASAPDGAAAWTVRPPAGRVRLIGGDGSAQVLPSEPGGGQVQVRAGGEGRLLVLADAYDDNWRANVDGQALQPERYKKWAQAFEVPASGGAIEVGYSDPVRLGWLLLQGLALLLTLIFMVPASGRAGGRESGRGAPAAPRRRQGSEGRRVGPGGSRAGESTGLLPTVPAAPTGPAPTSSVPASSESGPAPSAGQPSDPPAGSPAPGSPPPGAPSPGAASSGVGPEYGPPPEATGRQPAVGAPSPGPANDPAGGPANGPAEGARRGRRVRGSEGPGTDTERGPDGGPGRATEEVGR